MDFLRINGGYGEGGGQILRSAITLSCITKRPIHLENIRSNRRTPGLRPQHLTAIKILQKVADAKVIGAEIGSEEIRFTPGNVKDMNLVEDVGTAGSISLILQVLVPVVAVSKRRLGLRIRGGTDVPWSPTTDYTRHVLREAYSRMGIDFSLKLIKRGYYPRGGGEIELQVSPSSVKPASFSKQSTRQARLVCSFSKLAHDEIKGQVDQIADKLTSAGYSVDVEIRSEEALDSGASLLVFSADGGSIAGADSLYDKKTGRFDLDVGNFIQSHSVDDNLADMLVVPAGLSRGRTVLPVRKITKHLETNLFVTSKITGCRYGIGRTDNGFEVIIEGASDACIK